MAVLPVQSHATLPDSTRTELRRTIERGLRRARVEIVADAKVDARLDDRDCGSAVCASSLAEAVRAAWIVRPTITETDSVYEVQLEAVDERGRSLAWTSERCEICGYREVSELVIDRSAALAAKVRLLRRQAPRLTLRSNPTGARVWIDDRLVGRTPLEREVTAGEHEVRVELPGHVTEHRRIAAVEGTQDTLSFTMIGDPRARPRRPWLGLGVASLSTGAALAGAGAGLVAIDEREYQRRCNPDPQGHCSHRYDTLTGGAALLASGGVLALTGVVWLVVDRRARTKGARSGSRGRLGRGLVLAF